MSLGMLFSFGAALIWATTSLMVKANAGRVDTLSFNAFRVVVAGIFFLALAPFFGGVGLIVGMGLPTFLAISASVVLGFCVGDTVYFWSMTKIGASRTMPISGVFPVFTWLLAVPILGEAITIPAVIGTALVIVALFLLAHERPAEIAESNDMLITPPEDGTPPGGITLRTRYLAIGAALLAAFGVAGQLGYILAALVLVKAPWRVYRSLAYAPGYIGWKVVLYGRSLGAKGGGAWVRTARRTS